VTPRRRTTVLALLAVGTAAIFAPGAYLGYEASIGGVWAHNQALDRCALKHAPRNTEIGVRDKWKWWLPGHTHVCTYHHLG